jgi:hypothetical protein
MIYTKWEVAARENGKTRIYFYPITGRTHQLRVHAAHPLGLSNPIIGDDLYGTKADLNTNGKVPLEELPDSVAYGGLLYVGSWSFEYKDEKDDRAKESEGYYVDGGKYPNYDDAIKNLSVDKTQNDTLQPGWFWIVASSKKNDDNPTAKQTAAVQLNIDTGKIVDDVAANVIYDDKGNKLGTPSTIFPVSIFNCTAAVCLAVGLSSFFLEDATIQNHPGCKVSFCVLSTDRFFIASS